MTKSLVTGARLVGAAAPAVVTEAIYDAWLAAFDLLRRDARRPATSTAAAFNEEASIPSQHGALGVWYEVIVDRSRHEHGSLLMFVSDRSTV
jgi:hypothetical protein